MTEIDALLTNREKDIIRLMCKGYSNKKIAKILIISLPTVQTFSRSIMQKLGISSYEHNSIEKNVKRVQVVIKYLKEHKELLDQVEE